MAFGAIFDFDGTIFASVAHHRASWEKALQNIGKNLSAEEFQQGLGVKSQPFLTEILKVTSQEAASVLHNKETLFESVVQTGGVLPVPGTFSLICRLYDAKIPLAIGSASSKKTIDLLFSSYPEIYKKFSAFVCGEDVEYGKPNPDVFLKAAERLNLQAKDCIVFEDAPAGIQAAKAAGMKVVALTTTFSKEALSFYHPDALVDSLEELSVDEVRHLVYV